MPHPENYTAKEAASALSIGPSLAPHHRQKQAGRMRAVVVYGVGSDRGRRIGMGEDRVGQRGVAVGDFEPDAVALLEHVGDRQHLDVEAVDFSGLERLRIGVGVEWA